MKRFLKWFLLIVVCLSIFTPVISWACHPFCDDYYEEEYYESYYEDEYYYEEEYYYEDYDYYPRRGPRRPVDVFPLVVSGCSGDYEYEFDDGELEIDFDD